MTLRILQNPITEKELREMAQEHFGLFVKAVVDIRQGIVAIGGELHADGERLLIEAGSRQEDLWGINVYPDRPDRERIEFNSMINIRPSAGNLSRDVEHTAIREKIIAVTEKFIDA